eukprot:TRINITY_DN3921_c0_g1_i1.p1 TRINITY_DN3921_c0_g1~~TRINITY_DN3921_c0_g1_i1.p1  ORF type:complete len:154 (-),score=29.97 TRINITY_DN3921_c0_g1_i1:86-547(-)
MGSLYGNLLTVNAVFSLAAFPVHYWGWATGVDPFLLVFPASFSTLWLYYSWKKANRTICKVNLLEGHQDVQFFPYTFFGTAGKPFVIHRSKFSVVLDAEAADRAKRNQIDIIGEVQGTKLKKHTRYLIERWKGEVKDSSLYKLLFVFDNEKLE